MGRILEVVGRLAEFVVTGKVVLIEIESKAIYYLILLLNLITLNTARCPSVDRGERERIEPLLHVL